MTLAMWSPLPVPHNAGKNGHRGTENSEGGRKKEENIEY
jgi:hypothetical protein